METKAKTKKERVVNTTKAKGERKSSITLYWEANPVPFMKIIDMRAVLK
ncbi:hypothetical protein FACS1894162_6480 [Bacteroidia bacterium]|nr:hypothetical protein FACS1894162_6480 [Bacteroidia bacterium]